MTSGIVDAPILRRMIVALCVVSIGVLTVHGLSLLASDVVSTTGRTDEAWGWFVAYHLAMFLPLIGAAWWTRRHPSEVPSSLSSLLAATPKFLPWLIPVTVIGLLLHWDAKLRLLNGEGFDCWGQLRSAWLNQPDHLPTLHRIESVLGHLLSSAVYAGVFFSAMLYMAGRNSVRHGLYFLFFAGGGLLYALAIVSRSVMLVLLIVILLAVLLAYVIGAAPLRSLLTRSFPIVLGLPALMLAVALGLFSNTINCEAGISYQAADAARNKAALTYERGFFDELPVARSDPTPFQQAIRANCPPCNSMFIYLNHGISNFEQVLATTSRGGATLFVFAESWVRKLGLLSTPRVPSERVYGPGGLTLPGAALHDFGVGGLYATAFAHGVALLLAVVLLRRRGLAALLGVCLYVAGGISLALSGMFVGPAVIAFPFVMFSLCVCGALALLMGALGMRHSTAGTVMDVRDLGAAGDDRPSAILASDSLRTPHDANASLSTPRPVFRNADGTRAGAARGHP